MARLEPFEDTPFLAIAVSGGADSLALTLLADRWVRDRGGRAVGLTVDHRLRPGSADEARQTWRWLRAQGIEHHTLIWKGEKPETGLQRRARDARYALLTDWCRQNGCLHLLTAHHRQDQAETVALRQLSQSGQSGLAAMPAIREIRGLRLLRPLLGIDKATLKATLRVKGQVWLEDPSNVSPAFTRNRLRRQGLDVPKLTGEAGHHGWQRHRADLRIADALVRHVIIHPAGFATLDGQAFAQLPADLAFDLLTRLLVTVGGQIYPPRTQALARLHEAMHDGKQSAWTLAHCRIQKNRNRWLIGPERIATERLTLIPGRWQRWDGRFLVKLEASTGDLAIEALGQRKRLVEKALSPKRPPATIPSTVRPTLPAIWKNRRPVAVPHLGLYQPSIEPEQLDMRFSPHTPLANAPFMPHIPS